ncbi:MAG: ROK family protein [Actinomycetota bacterium]
MYSIGIDIGGTKIAGALVDSTGEVLRELKVPSPIDSSAAMVEAIVSLINQLAKGEKVVGAGVAAAGFLSADREIMYHAPNIAAWRNEPLKKLIATKVEVPVLLENDANAAGWAEFQFGAGKDVSSMIMLTIGTGVGGAVITGGNLIQGGFGIAGELGHVLVEPGGNLCGCGLKGCLETYASGTALLKSARELASSNDPKGKRLRELQEQDGELSGERVYQAILEGDDGAVGLVNRLAEYLGLSIGAIFVPVLDPQLAVIGGGVSAAGEVLLKPIREATLRNLPAKGFRPEIQVVSAKYLNQAGLIGAADLARLRFG